MSLPGLLSGVVPTTARGSIEPSALLPARYLRAGHPPLTIRSAWSTQLGRASKTEGATNYQFVAPSAYWLRALGRGDEGPPVLAALEHPLRLAL
jgi:hypothetical protein